MYSLMFTASFYDVLDQVQSFDNSSLHKSTTGVDTMLISINFSFSSFFSNLLFVVFSRNLDTKSVILSSVYWRICANSRRWTRTFILTVASNCSLNEGPNCIWIFLVILRQTQYQGSSHSFISKCYFDFFASLWRSVTFWSSRYNSILASSS